MSSSQRPSRRSKVSTPTHAKATSCPSIRVPDVAIASASGAIEAPLTRVGSSQPKATSSANLQLAGFQSEPDATNDDNSRSPSPCLPHLKSVLLLPWPQSTYPLSSTPSLFIHDMHVALSRSPSSPACIYVYTTLPRRSPAQIAAISTLLLTLTLSSILNFLFSWICRPATVTSTALLAFYSSSHTPRLHIIPYRTRYARSIPRLPSLPFSHSARPHSSHLRSICANLGSPSSLAPRQVLVSPSSACAPVAELSQLAGLNALAAYRPLAACSSLCLSAPYLTFGLTTFISSPSPDFRPSFTSPRHLIPSSSILFSSLPPPLLYVLIVLLLLLPSLPLQSTHPLLPRRA
ncbi:hypothetical protein R3P38DRAFT_3202149 [Favolaschia claudopus]|uniref:Uncharacterized protein n=1 Tax=Favolaschia claudopus TaxID=2862362 RepID=A0AAW0AV32_9AGAR